MLIVRCSSLDRAISCASSMAPTDSPYNPNSVEAREGTAAHEVRAGGEVGTIAEKYDLDVETLEGLDRQATKIWDEIKRWFPDARHEVRGKAELAADIQLTGTSDTVSATPDAIAINDWKFGWQPSEHSWQIRGYAYLARALRGMPESGYILAIESWVRIGEIRMRKFSAADLDLLRDELISQTRQIGKQWGPSRDACRYCPHQLHCTAHDEWARSAVTALAPANGETALTPALVGQLYERRQMLGKALDRYEEVLRAMLDQGPVPLGDGREIRWHESEQDKLVVSRAMSYLRETLELTPAEADECLSLTKSGLERVLKGRAPKGKGAAMMRDSMKRLIELEAVEKKTKRTPKVVDAKKETV